MKKLVFRVCNFNRKAADRRIQKRHEWNYFTKTHRVRISTRFYQIIV